MSECDQRSFLLFDILYFAIMRPFCHCSIGVKLHLLYALYHIVVQFIVPNYGIWLMLWDNFNKCTYLKAKVAYNNMHRQIVLYNRWDSASSMFVYNAIDTLDILLHKNIYGLKNAFLT